MKLRTQHMVKSIDWDQVPSGTQFIKFTAVDDSRGISDEKRYRIVLHGLVSEDGKVFITDELVTSDPQIVGKDPTDA